MVMNSLILSKVLEESNYGEKNCFYRWWYGRSCNTKPNINPQIYQRWLGSTLYW
ncbi:hypothetical protein LEQ41_02910 [Streptococcus agalactiae]|nr:hypothetical protein [Streptococcus agalactiae]